MAEDFASMGASPVSRLRCKKKKKKKKKHGQFLCQKNQDRLSSLFSFWDGEFEGVLHVSFLIDSASVVNRAGYLWCPELVLFVSISTRPRFIPGSMHPYIQYNEDYDRVEMSSESCNLDLRWQ